jgi:hypothetical protein
MMWGEEGMGVVVVVVAEGTLVDDSIMRLFSWRTTTLDAAAQNLTF